MVVSDTGPTKGERVYEPVAEAGDPAAATFLTRLTQVAPADLPEDWDGVYEMTTK